MIKAAELMTASEVAAVFGVDLKTVTRWALAGRLTGLKTPGGHWRFDAAEVAAKLGGQQS